VLVALTMGVIGLAGGLPEARKVKRELGRHRPETYASLKEGRVVTIHGRVLAGELAKAPMSGRSCTYWRLVFEEVGAGGDSRELGRTEETLPFTLRCAGGEVRVVPGSPLIALPGLVQIRGGLHDGRSDAVMRAARAVCRPMNYPQSSLLRVTEYVVVPETDITLRGYCTREPAPDAADAAAAEYRGQTPMRFVVSGTRRARVLIG